jgi:hypothetical protein
MGGAGATSVTREVERMTFSQFLDKQLKRMPRWFKVAWLIYVPMIAVGLPLLVYGTHKFLLGLLVAAGVYGTIKCLELFVVGAIWWCRSLRSMWKGEALPRWPWARSAPKSL